MNKKSKVGMLLAGVVIALALGAMGDDPDGAEAELAQYCGMVSLHKADPSVGWPDYNGNYDEVCR